jgi:hypothetical protein
MTAPGILRLGVTVGGGLPRLRFAERMQTRWRPVSLDGLLPDDHRVRLVWSFVEGLDVTALRCSMVQPTNSIASLPQARWSRSGSTISMSPAVLCRAKNSKIHPPRCKKRSREVAAQQDARPHPDYKFGTVERIDPKTGEAKVL